MDRRVGIKVRGRGDRGGRGRSKSSAPTRFQDDRSATDERTAFSGNRNENKKYHQSIEYLDDPDLDASKLYMAGQRRESPMTNKWRSDGNPRNRNYNNNRDRGRSRSPPPASHRIEPQSAPTGRGRFARDDYPTRPNRKRDFSPEPRRAPPRRPSISPARSPRLPPVRNRYPGDSAFTSRESSPARFAKRRRTRSPSPSDWSERNFGDRRHYSRSRSRDRYDQRDSRPGSRRGFSPRRASPTRFSRPVSRTIAPEVDTYIPERRRPGAAAPRQRPRRSASPRPRSITPPFRGRSETPPERYQSRPVSPASRYDSPIPKRGGRPRDVTPDHVYRRRPNSRTPSLAGDPDQEPMDVPAASRGQYANPNHIQRGRGGRQYNNTRGSFRGSSVAGSPHSSHHGSPRSNASYPRGRGGWDGGQQQHNSQNQNGPSFRQNNKFAGAGQSQEEYFRSQQQGNHPHPTQSQRPYRGGRGQHRGAPFSQQGQDRRFSGPDPPEPLPQRGRGGHFSNAQWNSNHSRGGGPPNQQATGPNSIRTASAISHKPLRDMLTPQVDQKEFQPPRGPQAEEATRQEYESNQQAQDKAQNHKDASKISFSFKSKPPPQSPAKPPQDLTATARPPPHGPASDRPPPTQPRGNKYHDKRPHAYQMHQERKRDNQEPPPRAPKGPQQQRQQYADKFDRTGGTFKQPRTRSRSRSPPPKKLKAEPAPFKPTLTPDEAASDSIYYRKPGNESVVGAGTYGKVFKALHIYTKHRVALKKIRMEGERDGFPITAVREIKLLQNLRHKHVVALQEVMVEKNECFMVFEYMSHDLTGLINHPTFKLTSAHKKDLGRQIFEGLEFLHRRGVMHRDIKAANLLISSEGRLKYADFGLARFFTKSRRLDYTNRVITIWYRPPELLFGETQYDASVDVWSAACVFMEMFTRKAIFPGEGGELSQLEKIYNVLGTPSKSEWAGIVDLPWYELMTPGLTSPSGEKKKRVFESQFEETLSPASMDLMSSIFRYDPADRPDAAEILQHEYFRFEEPRPRQAYELADVGGDWHEYESKAHRKENDRKEREKRREEHVKEREKEKRKVKEAELDLQGGEGKKVKGVDVDARVDEAPAAPLPAGEEMEAEVEMAMSDEEEGSARMSMS